MKPQPMSDAEIDAMLLDHGASGAWTDDEHKSASSLVAKANAARDAQWAAMIGEPVAYVKGPQGFLVVNHDSTWKRPTSQTNWSAPLYAIKETP